MKRYIVFMYKEFYPCGVKDDEYCRVNTRQELNEKVTGQELELNGFNAFEYYEYTDILDLQTGEWLTLEEFK